MADLNAGDLTSGIDAVLADIARRVDTLTITEIAAARQDTRALLAAVSAVHAEALGASQSKDGVVVAGAAYVPATRVVELVRHALAVEL